MDGKKELGLENIPDELNNKYQDFMQRRIIIAMAVYGPWCIDYEES